MLEGWVEQGFSNVSATAPPHMPLNFQHTLVWICCMKLIPLQQTNT